MPVTKDLTLISSLPKMDIPNVSFPDFALPAMEKVKHKLYETDGLTGYHETYGQLLDKSLRIASFLQRNGLGIGNNIGIHCGNVYEYSQVAFGIARSGCTIVGIRGETARELRGIIEDSCPVYIFTETRTHANVLEAVGNSSFCKDIVIFGVVPGCLPLNKILEDDGQAFKKPDIVPEESVLLISYSGGTTGLPKGVQLTHKNFVASIILEGCWPNEKNPVHTTLVYSKPVHLSGSWFRLMSLSRGDHVVLLPSFDAEIVYKTIERYSVGQIGLMQTTSWTLLNGYLDSYKITSLKRVVVGGGTIPKDVAYKLKKLLNCSIFLILYAQTEALCTLMPTDSLDSIGTLHGNCEAKVVHTETGKALPAGQIGELCVKGPSVMKGYLNSPEATKKAIDEEGWLHSGDLVYYDDKERFFFVERTKEILKCMDSQVYPFELEQILVSHPSVSEAVVIGVPHDEYGEIPRAYVVLKQPCQEEDLIEFVNKLVADYKKLRAGLRVVDHLPKTDVDKYQRKQLRAQYLEELKESNAL